MIKFILIFISLFAVLCFDISAQIIKKYKDGVSIDSLVVKWPRLNYSQVVNILKEQGIEYKESSYPSTDINDKKIMVVWLRFYKVYYKGLFIGDGSITFDSGTGKDFFNKNIYRLKGFTSDLTGEPDYVIEPTYKDILSAYTDLRSLYLKRCGRPEAGPIGADSLITADSDADLIFSYLKSTDGWIGYSWVLDDTGDAVGIGLHLDNRGLLRFSINWYPECVPDKKNGMKRK